MAKNLPGFISILFGSLLYHFIKKINIYSESNCLIYRSLNIKSGKTEQSLY